MRTTVSSPPPRQLSGSCSAKKSSQIGQRRLADVSLTRSSSQRAPGAQWASVIAAPTGKHSEKPEKAIELIEAYFPTLPKIELHARKRRSGCDSWGTLEDEIEP